MQTEENNAYHQVSNEEKMSQRTEGKRLTHLIAEGLLASILIAGLLVTHYARPPFNRGFFCNDQSIQKPYVAKQSVPSSLALGVSLVLSLIVIHMCEVMQYVLSSRPFSLQIDEMKVKFLGFFQVSAWIYRMYSRIWYCLIGMIITVFFTELGKQMVGRLRPHFLAVCKPNYALFNCSDGFITIDYCTGVQKQIIEARKSFPSGHSSFSAYVAVFLCLYLHFAVRSKGVKLLNPIIQMAFVGLALFTALGRISDYFHHWSDVLAGLIIGTFVAFYVVFMIMDLKNEEQELKIERRNENCGIMGNDVENYGSTAVAMDPQHEPGQNS